MFEKGGGLIKSSRDYIGGEGGGVVGGIRWKIKGIGKGVRSAGVPRDTRKAGGKGRPWGPSYLVGGKKKGCQNRVPITWNEKKRRSATGVLTVGKTLKKRKRIGGGWGGWGEKPKKPKD